ncbi:putative aquaporin TIP3-2 [Hordeum vulgare]|nr:putative aquaporin TIP3-2 [Hordeum vulgare]
MIFYQGKLYILQETGGHLLSVSVGEDSDTGEPAVTRVDRLMRVPVWGYIEPPLQYLLESDGALLMIRRKDPNVAEPLQFPGNGGLGLNRVGAGLEKATGFKVFAADLAGSRWTKVKKEEDDADPSMLILVESSKEDWGDSEEEEGCDNPNKDEFWDQLKSSNEE